MADRQGKDVHTLFRNAQLAQNGKLQPRRPDAVISATGELTKKISGINKNSKTAPSRGQRRSGTFIGWMTDERTRSNTRVPDPEYDRGQSIPAAETLFDPRRDVIGRGSTTQPPRNTGTTKPKETPRRRATQSSHKPTVQQQPLAPRPSAADQTLPEKAVEDPKAQEEEEEEEEVIPFKQLDVPQIQPDQLIREAKSIYAAMLMVENKCNEVDRQEEAKVRAGDIQSIPATRYKELVVLHRTLLYEQYDFFLACSHPAATQQLRLLPHKYGMPGRIWKSGIHTFLEVLRHHLPESLEHMLTFLHMAYGVVCLLYETIPSHKATWIECLGDLARYRMAVEERDAEIREIWTDRAREWYYAATDIFPSVGRLYHHLAIVARQNPVEQLYLYVKSLTVDLIFTGTRESVLILFQTVSRETPGASLVTSVDYSFVQLHQILFTKVDLDFMRTRAEQFIPLLRSALEYSSDPETPEYWGSRPTHMAICGIGSLYQYGAREGIFRSFNEAPDTSATASGQSVPQNSKDQPTPPPPPKLECADRLEGDEPVTQSQQFILAKELAMQVLQTFLSCNIENAKVLHVQSWMVFLDFFVRHRKGIMENFLEADMPWDQLVQYINTLFRESKDYILDFSPEPVFPAIPNAPASADDYALRALVWASDFHPKGYFTDHLPESDRSYEHPPGTAGAAANLKLRKERILYLAARICVTGGYFKYDEASQQFELDSALQTRRREHAIKAASADTPMTPATPLTDSASFSDMGDELAGVLGSASKPEDIQTAPEHIKALLQQHRDLESRLQRLKSHETEADYPSAVSEVGLPKSIDNICKNKTTVVVDTNFLLSNLRIFDHILRSGDWVVVVPNPVVIELLGISRNEEASVGHQAKQALYAINDAATNNNPNLRIITSRGNRIQQPGFYRENISNYKAGLEGGIDNVIINIAVMLGDGEAQGTDAIPVVLLTNDTNMRILAKTYGVLGISGDNWSKKFGPSRVEKRAEKRKMTGIPKSLQ